MYLLDMAFSIKIEMVIRGYLSGHAIGYINLE